MHLQIRAAPIKSPPNLEEYLAVLERAGVNILAAGGSNVEEGGEFAFAVEDGKEQAAIDALEAEDYHPRLVEVDFCWLRNEPGQLHGCVAKTASLNASAGRHIKDVSVGVPNDRGEILVQIYSEDNPSSPRT